VTRSFRDPAGAVLRHGSRILRIVYPESVTDLEAFLATGGARQAMEAGKLVRSVRLPAAESADLGFDQQCVYEHERVSFASYPAEWPPEMLHAAGELTLELFGRALEDGFGLKDATPYNVLFRGPHPIFVDVLSFERRD